MKSDANVKAANYQNIARILQGEILSKVKNQLLLKQEQHVSIRK